MPLFLSSSVLFWNMPFRSPGGGDPLLVARTAAAALCATARWSLPSALKSTSRTWWAIAPRRSTQEPRIAGGDIRARGDGVVQEADGVVLGVGHDEVGPVVAVNAATAMLVRLHILPEASGEK